MIEVGEYVRLKNGKIIKFKRFGKLNIHNIVRNQKLHKNIHINEHDIASIKTIIGENSRHYSYDNIVKHSKNIIDLIETGDYVNGCLIVEINKDTFIKGQINLWTNMLLSEGEPFPNEYYKAKILGKDIKTVVTKEQFANAEYKLEC